MENLSEFKADVDMKRCQKCGNNCLLTINTFQDGRKFISGNRCEKVAGIESKDKDIQNL